MADKLMYIQNDDTQNYPLYLIWMFLSPIFLLCLQFLLIFCKFCLNFLVFLYKITLQKRERMSVCLYIYICVFSLCLYSANSASIFCFPTCNNQITRITTSTCSQQKHKIMDKQTDKVSSQQMLSCHKKSEKKRVNKI